MFRLRSLFLGFIFFYLNHAIAFNPIYLIDYQLQNGDLLFQDLNCGELCDGINYVTYGFKNSYVSHVSMIISIKPKPMVIEARSSGVVITSLEDFLNRSLDQDGKPRVMVGRLLPKYQPLIPKAIDYAKEELGKPYNSTFINAYGKAFYCSELIDYAFRMANNGKAVFQQNPMDFTNGKTSQILPIWQKYYSALNLQVPQGVQGSNPGEFSRESILKIVFFYGDLRTHK